MSNQVELIADNTYVVYRSLTFLDRSINPKDAKIIVTQNLINVTPTLDKRNEDGTENRIVIAKGSGMYPDYILKWGTVKHLIDTKHIRAIQVVDTTRSDDELGEVKAGSKKVKRGTILEPVVETADHSSKPE